MAVGITLGDLKSQVTSTISTSEAALKSKLSAIADGDDVTNLDLLTYQMELTSNSLTSGTASAIAKERGDTLKGVVQKF